MEVKKELEISEAAEKEFVQSVIRLVQERRMTIHNTKAAMEKVYSYLEGNATLPCLESVQYADEEIYKEIYDKER